MPEALQRKVMQLIEADVGEFPVGRLRRLLEAQRAKLPDAWDLIHTHHAGPTPRLLESPLRLTLLAPTALAAMATEQRHRYRAWRRLKGQLALARTLQNELDAARQDDRSLALGSPFRQLPGHQGHLSPLRLLLTKADQVLLLSYLLSAPLPWNTLRLLKGVALMAWQQEVPQLVLNAHDAGGGGALRRLAPALAEPLRQHLGERLRAEAWTWVKGKPESLQAETA